MKGGDVNSNQCTLEDVYLLRYTYFDNHIRVLCMFAFTVQIYIYPGICTYHIYIHLQQYILYNEKKN